MLNLFQHLRWPLKQVQGDTATCNKYCTILYIIKC